MLGVGNDWDNAIARSPGTGQTVVHQYLAPVGDTYWVQTQSGPILLSGTTVSINDTAPTRDRYNLSIVEILAAAGGTTTGSISGTISPAANGNGATITLSQSGTTVATTTVGAAGTYSFSSVVNGSYNVTPSNAGYVFTPPSQSVTVNGASSTAVNFVASLQSWSIQGSISPPSWGTGATVTLTQGSTTVATTTVGAAGTYSFGSVVNGTYTVTPSNAGYVFTPGSQSVTVNGAGSTAVNFAASLQSWSIQGSISPPSWGTGATVTLTQGSTTVATTTVDSNGNYSLNGVVNGTYSVTPTKSGYACTPLSQSVTMNGAPVTGINFTASTLPTYSISGMISPAANGSGATVTLSGAASATTTADTSGAFSFSGLANGSYTVTATKAGFAISPASQPVSVNNALVTGVNFTATTPWLAIDVVAYGDANSASTTAVTSAFSTTSRNELLLAFISADSTASPNTTVTQVAGGGLTWVLVERTNVQKGTAEIWRAFAVSALSGVTVTATLSQKVNSSITVMSFTGVNTSGTNGSGAIGAVGSGNADPGAPTATLVTTANGSLVLGVGNDWDNGIARTLGPNQAMVHQFLANVGDTYWVQRESNATSSSGASVTLNDSAPTSDRYNLTIVEVLPATVGTAGAYSIYGTLSPSAQGSGATVTLSGTASGTTTTDGSGNYGFNGLSNGSYTVTPGKSGYSFRPAAQSVTINGANVAVNFTVSSSQPPVAVSMSPTSAALSTGGQQQFTAYVSGTSNTAVTWSASAGTVTSRGLYTAPGTAGTNIVTATSAADTTKSASASVTVSQSSQVSVSVSPTAISINQGAQQQFTATVAGTSNTGVNWSVISGSGTISPSGLFTAPNKQESDTVQAQSQADTTKTAVASVTVPAVSLSFSPLSATVQPNGTQQFTATVSGTTNTGVLWSEIGNGSVSQAGLYTAPGSSETDTVTATAAASSAATRSASVSVQSQSQNACGDTLNWTSSTCQVPAVGRLNTAIVNGVNDPNAWTIISRHGEYQQQETEGNVPSAISVHNGYLDITATAQSVTVGDFDPNTGTPCSGLGSPCPGTWPYTVGDVQWNAANFLYGTFVARFNMPSSNTALWPAIWWLAQNCQNSNKYTGDTGLNGCPNLGSSGYSEIDSVECMVHGGNWCGFNTYNPTASCGQSMALSPSPGWHTVQMIWTANGIQEWMDGTQRVNCGTSITSRMFLILQVQTGGVNGSPNNSALPAHMLVDYVKACTTTDGSCSSVPNNDPSVYFFDDFGGPAN